MLPVAGSDSITQHCRSSRESGLPLWPSILLQCLDLRRVLTANSWNSVGSRASPSMICWNHDATDLACGCTSPQAKCFEVARGFVQDVALNATVCAGPAPTFLGHLTSLPRHTGGGFPHSLTVRPRRSGGFGGVVAGASVMCVTKNWFAVLKKQGFGAIH